MKTFYPEKWLNVPTKETTPTAAAPNSAMQKPVSRYDKGSSENTQNRVEHVVSLIEQNKVDITDHYDVWVKVGFALSSEFNEGGRDFFHRVSRQSAKYTVSESNKQYDKCLTAKGNGITIGTFFQLAKDAGIDISSSQSSDHMIIRSNEHSPDLIKCSNDRMITDTKVENQEIEDASRWIVSEDKLPHFQKDIYSRLPLFLQSVVDLVSEDKKDYILMGTVVIISSTLPNVYGIYHDVRVWPMLYFFLSGPAGIGKGTLELLRSLVMPIHRELLEKTKEEERQEKEKKAQAKADGETYIEEKIPHRQLFIPADSSAAAFKRELHESDGVGLLMETEGDTLTNMLGNDVGNYTDLIRKCSHHETISLNRSTDREHLEIPKPKLSIILSGTPNQLKALIKSPEDGTFSRLNYYSIGFELRFSNVFAHTRWEDSLEYKLVQLGERYKQYYDRFHAKEFVFVIPEKFQQRFIADMDETNFGCCADISTIMQASVRRNGLTVYRIAMILTALRYMSGEDVVQQTDNGHTLLVCSDDDFETAMQMGSVLMTHACYVFLQMFPHDARLTDSTTRKMGFFSRLPEQFTRGEYNQLAVTAHVKAGTANRWFAEFKQDMLIESVEHGVSRLTEAGIKAQSRA